MINRTYQLMRPKFIGVKFDTINLSDGDQVLIRPLYLALCHADQRYYRGKRDAEVLKKKLPMAPVHEAVGEVVYDGSGHYAPGTIVAMIPNQPYALRDGFYENYQPGYFRSSGHDGFMREFVRLPHDRMVPIGQADPLVSTITEFISVAVHATMRFDVSAHAQRNHVAIWGDGSLSFVLASVLKARWPEMHLTIVGHDYEKMALFTFADERLLSDELPHDFRPDHAFECCGGDGCFYAIDDIIRTVAPQASVMLMGVSENRVSINTRDILEKGLTFIGCSRSGLPDFEMAVKLLQEKKLNNRLRRIIHEAKPIRTMDDIHDFFSVDMSTTFKTVARWEV